MLGLDDHIAAMGGGETLLVVLAVAGLLGLRHATDPDHLTAVSTLIAGEGRTAGVRQARRLGLAWGGGHALTLCVLGMPIVLFDAYLPAKVATLAECAIGLLIVALALRVLMRWRRGYSTSEGIGDPAQRRSPYQAFCIGLLHGVGGSAGVGVLLLAAIPDHLRAILMLVVFSACTAVAMAAASASCGWVLVSHARSGAFAPVLGSVSLAFGVWYFLAALDAVPYAL